MSLTLDRATATSLKPKEHGAYAILAIPLVTALLLAGPTFVGLLVTAAAVAGFLANEPLLVVCGHRGRRAMRAAGTAKPWLWGQLGLATICGAAALAIGPPLVRAVLLGCLLLAIIGFAFSLRGHHRSLASQLWGTVALSAPSVPVLLASGCNRATAVAIWLVWIVGFLSTTVAVRGVIAAQKRQARGLLWMILISASLTCALLLWGLTDGALAAAPMIAMSWYLMLEPPPARKLKQVGWSLAGATVFTGVLIVLRF